MSCDAHLHGAPERPVFTPDLMEALSSDAARAIFAEGLEAGRPPEGARGVFRTAYSSAETDMLDRLSARAAALGLEESVDAVGNRFYTLPGRDRTLPALWCGSHVDSVPGGGNFDGLAGIAAAFCAVEAWGKTGLRPKRDFIIACFRAEEPGLLGTFALFGKMNADLAARRIDPRPGTPTVAEHHARLGFDLRAASSGRPVVDTSRIAAFLELHIEQAPSLEADPVVRTGLVTGIRGRIACDAITVIGESAHAGAIERPYRRDAVAAAAEVVSRLNAYWAERLEAGADLVATFGVFATPLDAVFNKVSGAATLAFEARSLSVAERDACRDRLFAIMRDVSAETGVAFAPGPLSYLEPQHSDASLLAKLSSAADRAGVPVRRMASGAGHDAQNFGVAGIPFAMIFVANAHSSHNPDEALTIEDFLAGAAVLAETALDY